LGKKKKKEEGDCELEWGRCFCVSCEDLIFYFPPDVELCMDDDMPFYCEKCAREQMKGLN